ncbi:MAG: sensor histidine kinase [Coleofasciculaceae cyanobacterium]
MPPLQLSTRPIRLLLYLEWVLLSVVALTEILAFSFPRHHKSPLLALICIGLFGVMGIRLPNHKPLYKVLYTSLEISLILLASSVGRVRLLPLLLIILVLRNGFIFKGYSRFVVTGFAFTFFLMNQMQRFQSIAFRQNRPPRPPPFVEPDRLTFVMLSSTVVFGLVLVFLQLLVDAVLAERKSREELTKVNEQLRQYALRIEDMATLQERNRIAREIHDSLGHSLTVFNLHLEAALRLLQSNPNEAREFILEAKELGKTALREVRQSVSTLRSNPLENQSLEVAIDSLLEDFRKSTGISPTCQIDLKGNLTTQVKTVIYRIVQEALTNIYKYAAATEVEITIQVKKDLHLMIKDNGKGFNLNQNTTGFGLQGMRERTTALGGSFKIVTAPSAGCQIIADLPLPGVSK